MPPPYAVTVRRHRGIRKERLSYLVIALLCCTLLYAGCSSHGNSSHGNSSHGNGRDKRSGALRERSSAAKLVPTSSSHLIAWDTFATQGKSLDYSHAPGGQVYRTAGPTSLAVRNGRVTLVGHPGPTGYSGFLEVNQPRVPSAVAAEFEFTAGASQDQSFLIVESRVKPPISQASLQLASTPTSWQMLEVTDARRHVIDKGRYAEPLATNGKVRYRIAMSFDSETATISATLPNGDRRSWPIPQLREYWGSLFAIQLIRPSDSAGGVVCTAYATATK